MDLPMNMNKKNYPLLRESLTSNTMKRALLKQKVLPLLKLIMVLLWELKMVNG